MHISVMFQLYLHIFGYDNLYLFNIKKQLESILTYNSLAVNNRPNSGYKRVDVPYVDGN